MASKYRKKFAMPEGFYQILEDYSREVLRDQPRDIVEYSYLYFKALEEVSIIAFNFCFQFHLISSPWIIWNILISNEKNSNALTFHIGNFRSIWLWTKGWQPPTSKNLQRRIKSIRIRLWTWTGATRWKWVEWVVLWRWRAKSIRWRTGKWERASNAVIDGVWWWRGRWRVVIAIRGWRGESDSSWASWGIHEITAAVDGGEWIWIGNGRRRRRRGRVWRWIIKWRKWVLTLFITPVNIFKI